MGSTNLIRMLSRQAISRATQARNCLVVSSRGLSVSTPNPERDLVNFPDRVRPIDKPPVRMGIFPEEWFTALYPKTGVTGPYMALFGVSTFLASKEYFVMEHDFYVGIGLAIVLTYLVKTQGPAYTAELNKQLDEEEAALRRSGRTRLTPALPRSRESRPFRSRPPPGRTSSPPRRRPLGCSWRESTAAGSPLPTLLLRRGSTTRWRRLMC